MAEKPAIPLAIVGASFRDVPTRVRSWIQQLDDAADSPSKALLAGKHVDGVVRIATCSRVEFVLSTATPEWASSMLNSALVTRSPHPVKLHTKHGLAAAHYLFKVVLGLDSVAEGEAAVGRQVLKGFASAHRDGSCDAVLRRVWKETETVVHARREYGEPPAGWGVQSLVVERLREVAKSDAPIVVWGLGEIGRATFRALGRGGFTSVWGLKRDQHDELLKRIRGGAHVVVCTGAAGAYLELPAPANDTQLCIDVGYPAQVRSAEGWVRVDLDELLSGQRSLLDEKQREQLGGLARDGAHHLRDALLESPRTKHLSTVQETRRRFFSEELPPLLSDLPKAKAEALRKSLAQFAHQMLRAAREAES